ncbi:GAF domain-containing protein [Mycobacterium sp. 236(2023)]|uniref:GAF domain-containing protein n=1 Tax=Mycobacterium sp. 236(2023) TaxID=3038163 RepID=UPI00241538E4|nr:GAF domain-containing protein [Mycobacterium sp. 236(2023)]MDG4664036.1 GAF domain-containing protein [Mycobacterium sp. 236(2023)]
MGGQVDPTELVKLPLPGVVAESWRRSLGKGVDPDRQGPRSATDDVLEILRRDNPLTAAMPMIRRLLVDDATDSGFMVAVTDVRGTLLWVEGHRRAIRKAEDMNFLPGADWSERSAGTNAPGTSLVLGREVQIRGWEHFSRVAQPWSCTAAPVLDPTTGVVLGAIDLTGLSSAATPQTLALVRATAEAVGKYIALQRLTEPAAEPATDDSAARLTVLGAERATWTARDAAGVTRTSTLAPRHADILVLLTRHPEGLSADHLAVLLDSEDLDVVTVRAEVTRLRRAIGARFVGSKPYRLLEPVTSDLDIVLRALEAGDVRTALDHYGGPLLPNSTAPGITRLRVESRSTVHGAVVASGDQELLARLSRISAF